MKKLLTFTLALASLGFMGSWSETKGNAVTKTNPQVQIQIGRRRHWDRRYYNRGLEYRTTIETRIVHEGWRTYRDTYQVRYFPDGRVQWVLVNRERVY